MAEENNNASNQAPMSGGNSGGSDTPTNPFAGGGIPDFGGGSTSPTGGGASTQGSAASGSPIEGSSGSQGGGSMGSGSASGEGEYEWDIEGSESQGNGSMGGGPQGGNPFGGGGSMGGSVGDGGEEPAIVGTNITLNVSGDGEVEGEQLSMGEDGSVPYLGNNISPLSDDGNSENYEYDLTGAEQSASSGGGEEMTM
ncbi:MAG: hypothetical protein BRC55_11295 [Cyanobacteria bacterium SW_8_48_13]|nr:MAG: hypothetical protein BRC55_11295 [Cyanobacteria bacterium SW_8_48_13]